MKFNFFTKGILVPFFILLVFVFKMNGQNQDQNTFKYISPKPGSKYIMPENNIAFRYGDEINTESVRGFTLEVTGSLSGEIVGKFVFSDDNKTLMFLPEKPFKYGERVSVSCLGSINTKSGISVSTNPFWFDITDLNSKTTMGDYTDKELDDMLQFANPSHSKYTVKGSSVKNNNLPDDFPELTVEVSNSSSNDGYYFACPFGYWGWFPENVPYLMIFDDFGTPVFYRKLTGHGYDFKKHSNGKISHFLNNWPNSFINVLDSSYNIVDTYTMQNGYNTDFHEFLMFPNGHVIVEGYDAQLVDMSEIVEGGDPEAIVAGWNIQELDANKNVVFQWRTWDHLEIIDALGYQDLTSSNFDPFHGNAIEVHNEDFLILSLRNTNELIKISRITGEVIWRMEGNNNMFEFINDTLGFSWQHDCRILENGNLSLFDNGVTHTEPPFSSLIEYELDETNLTVTQVKRYRSNPDIYGVIMGNAQQTPDDKFVVGWGSGVPGVTEFTESGEVEMEFYFAGINYRAYKHNWKTNRFYPESDSISFGYLWMEETRTKTIKLFNDQNEDIVLTSYHSRTNNYTVNNEFPFAIPAGGSRAISITFNPESAGIYEDYITFNSDINTEELVQRIAQQIYVVSYVSEGQGIGENSLKSIVVYPNPVKENLNVKWEAKNQSVSIKLFDAFGKIVGSYSIENNNETTLDISSLSSGLYFMQITDLDSNASAIVKVQKQ